MKNHDLNHAMPPWQTLNECRREDPDHPAHSNGELDSSPARNRISVQFAPLSQLAFEIKIRQAPKKPAKTRSLDSMLLRMAASQAITTLGEL